jgi:uncharacterized membrane protein
VSGLRNTRAFLVGIRAKAASKLVAKIKGQTLLLVPETADGFRTIIGALRSVNESEHLSFHTFSLSDN